MKPLLLALALLQGMAAYAGAGHSNGYTVRFDERIEMATGDLHGFDVGRIRIVRTADQGLVWQENTPLQPGCGTVAAVTVLNDIYVALCGHLGGRHHTQKIIFMQGNSPSMVNLDQFDSPSAVRVERDGSLAIDVLRRDRFPGELTGPHYFPTVYRLHHDDATFGFASPALMAMPPSATGSTIAPRARRRRRRTYCRNCWPPCWRPRPASNPSVQSWPRSPQIYSRGNSTNSTICKARAP